MRNKGFTLIETIIYIALLTLFIGSGVTTAFYLTDSAEKGKADINASADAEFLLQKISWVLNDVQSITTPTSGATAATLSVNKTGSGTNPFVVDLASGRARLARGSATPVELTGDRVTIANLSFIHIAAVVPKPAGIQVSFMVNNKSFSMTKYLRK